MQSMIYKFRVPTGLALGHDGLTFTKEIAYVGQFVKAESDQEFEISKKDLDHWDETFVRMRSAGVKVPVPLRHTSDPTSRRGTVIAMSRGVDHKKRDALFATIKFVDPDAAKLAASADVSIFVPDEFIDGTGNEYKKPITHVALTDYPVLPDMEPFKPIVASFKGETTMAADLNTLSQKLGLQVEEGMAPDELEAKIVEVFQMMKAKIDELGGASEPDQPATGDDTVSADVSVKYSAPFKLPPGIAASFGTLTKDNRRMKIDQLVQAGNITKACGDDLVKEWCSDEALKLSMSDGADQQRFDRAIETLKKNQVIRPGERTGGQRVALSHDGRKGEKNALQLDAERRAEAAKA